MPRVLSRSVRSVPPTLICYFPAFNADICWGIWRIAASTSPHVGSAAAYDGVPGCWLEDTMTPSRVQASTSMCG